MRHKNPHAYPTCTVHTRPNTQAHVKAADAHKSIKQPQFICREIWASVTQASTGFCVRICTHQILGAMLSVVCFASQHRHHVISSRRALETTQHNTHLSSHAINFTPETPVMMLMRHDAETAVWRREKSLASSRLVKVQYMYRLLPQSPFFTAPSLAKSVHK